jgi:hypothetical protein
VERPNDALALAAPLGGLTSEGESDIGRNGQQDLSEFLAANDSHDKFASYEGLERLNGYLAARSATGGANRYR